MTTEGEMPATDLIRWTFSVPPAAVAEVEAHLGDLGAEVFVRNGQMFHVFWEETDVDLDAAVEAIWGLAAVHFEITQEEFGRRELHILYPDGERDAEEQQAEFHPEMESLEIKEL